MSIFGFQLLKNLSRSPFMQFMRILRDLYTYSVCNAYVFSFARCLRIFMVLTRRYVSSRIYYRPMFNITDASRMYHICTTCRPYISRIQYNGNVIDIRITNKRMLCVLS